jgi:carboxypeptidase family protein
MFMRILRGSIEPRLARLIAVLILSSLTLVSGTSVWAQLSTASLNGTVQDSTGAVIPGAKVALVQTQTDFKTETVSGPDGSFRISSIPVGPYVLRVAKEGFESYKQEGIVLTVGQVATLQISLTVGAANQNIVVTAETPVVESTDSTIQTVVDQQVVSELPLNGRNPAALMYTAAGVTDATINPLATNANSTVASGVLSDESAPTANGVRPGGTYFSLDGAGNVDPYSVIGGPFPNPDATQEFSVVTGSYGARYVSAPGGAVNIVTKSGTNQIHGSAFEFVRNGFFNAENRFATVPDTLKRNQFGFAAGGPILRDKLFAFGSYQQTLIRSQTLIDSYVGIDSATENMRAGQFKSAITGDVVQLPVSTVAANLMKYIPPPNYTLGGNLAYYNTTVPNDINSPEWVGKIDYNLGQHRLFARYFSEHTNTPADQMQKNALTSSGLNALTAQGSSSGFWDTFALGDTWTSRSGSWVADARASWTKSDSVGSGASSLSALSITALGAAGVSDGVFPMLPTFYSIGGLFVSGNPYGDNTRTSWDYSVDVLHPFGKHELSFGTDLRFVGLDQTSYSGQNPAFVFLGLDSLYGGYGPLDNNGYADLILGHPFEFFQADGSFDSINGHLFGIYAEDKYRATSRMTLTGGLRWDPYLPYVPASNHMDCWNPGEQSRVFTNAPKGLIYPGDPGCSSGGTSAKYGLLQPRVGVAYKLDQAGKSALRAGWGMYSTQFPLISLLGFSAPPFVRSFLVAHPLSSQSIDAPWTSMGDTDPFASGFTNASYKPPSDVSFANAEAVGFSPSAIDKNFQPTYVEQWTLSLQHAFTSSDSIELAYVGTQGIHIAQSYDANLPVYNGSAAKPASTRPYASEGLGQLLTLVSDSTSNYNGLNATFHHRNRGGLDLVSAFNWSKCLDDGSIPPSTAGAFGATGVGDNSVAGGAYLPHARYGRCDFDQNLTFRTTAVWNSPAFKGNGMFLRTVAGAWTVSGLVVADAGQPFSITDSANDSQTGLNLDRADWTKNGAPAYVNGQLNKAAFQMNAPGTYGNVQRNSFRSYKWVHVDPAVMKTFPLGTEHLHLMFRAEAFNVFNHPTLTTPVSDINSAAFGVLGGARDPRILQFSLKLLF